MDSKAIIVSKSSEVSMLPVNQMKTWYQSMVEFGKEILQEGHDYGTIPGTPKPCLYQPGAEKLRVAYCLQVSSECIEKTEDLTSGLLDYTYKTKILTPNGMVIGDKDGSANSYEPNFRYIWVPEHKLPSSVNKSNLETKGGKRTEFAFAISKAETTGQYGKPSEYWKKFQDAIDNGLKPFMKKASTGREMEAYEIDDIVYKIQNPDIMGKKNTIQKIAQKRSFVAAILQATGASEFFTQDVEDFHDFGQNDSSEPPAPPAPVASDKKEESKKETKPKAVKPAEPKSASKQSNNEVKENFKKDLDVCIDLKDLKRCFTSICHEDSFLSLPETDRQEIVKTKDKLKKDFDTITNLSAVKKKNLSLWMHAEIKKSEDLEMLNKIWGVIFNNPHYEYLDISQKESLMIERDTIKAELSNDEKIITN